MGQFYPEQSFRSFNAYGNALSETPWRFYQRLVTRSSFGEETGEMVKRSGNVLKKNLTWWDLMWFTIGAVIGAGVFVLTGQEANQTAGPAIILSYAAAGFAAMLAVLAYTEFACEIPVAGGSFAYLRVELGDFVAFIGAGNIILEYIVGGAAVARAWTDYFTSLIDKQADDLRISTDLADGYNLLDPLAVGVLIVTMLVAIYSTKGTSILNWVASIINMVIILFVIVAGLRHAETDNYTPFNPYGVHGIFKAASVLFFAYLGFDAVSTMAEETKNPGRDIPIGLVAAMVITTVIYCLMALTICLMVPYEQINSRAGFSYAFESVGMKWAKYLVALGALKGMTTVILVSNVGQARYLTHIARTHMVPPLFANVNGWTKTPINATVAMTLATCVVAFFSDLSILGNLLSVSTLFMFSLVALALLIRRYYDPVQTSPRELRVLVASLIVIIGASVAIAGYWASTTENEDWPGYVIAVPIWALATVAIHFFCPQRRTPRVWGVPWLPWLPSLTIAFNFFLLGSMDKDSYIRFAVWTAAILVYYFFVGLHASYDAAAELRLLGVAEHPSDPATVPADLTASVHDDYDNDLKPKQSPQHSADDANGTKTGP
ncbi:hypothetical protein Mapa_007488 [Marchantia paleacea]|nr:hypothetical protein Mapa_007488 [Marchantia paleacea]